MWASWIAWTSVKVNDIGWCTVLQSYLSVKKMFSVFLIYLFQTITHTHTQMLTHEYIYIHKINLKNKNGAGKRSQQLRLGTSHNCLDWNSGWSHASGLCGHLNACVFTQRHIPHIYLILKTEIRLPLCIPLMLGLNACTTTAWQKLYC